MNPQVDIYLSSLEKWCEEQEKLREIVLDCMLTEEVKWGQPCYTYQKSNVVLIHGFKEYCALLFFKGALLSNADGLLVRQSENTQAVRQIRFKSLTEIVALAPVIKATIFEAIEVEKAGLKVESAEIAQLTMPEELLTAFDNDPALKTAFEALTPGRQRAYILHFSDARQSKTREARIGKCIPRILIGKGLTDCVCGLTRKRPGCDGSHKALK